jgi:MFS family permease
LLSSAAVMTIGAGTLADIYDPKERGSMLGVYYAAPLLGPAIGPILGGGEGKAQIVKNCFNTFLISLNSRMVMARDVLRFVGSREYLIHRIPVLQRHFPKRTKFGLPGSLEATQTSAGSQG